LNPGLGGDFDLDLMCFGEPWLKVKAPTKLNKSQPSSRLLSTHSESIHLQIIYSIDRKLSIPPGKDRWRASHSHGYVLVSHGPENKPIATELEGVAGHAIYGLTMV